MRKAKAELLTNPLAFESAKSGKETVLGTLGRRRNERLSLQRWLC